MLPLLALALVAASAPPERAPVADVAVVRDGNRWSAALELKQDAPVWVFAKSVLPRESKQSWRLRTVRVETPGATLQRIGDYDALVAARGNVPREVRLSFVPFTEDIEAGYDAALAFSGGAVALYTSQFKLVPMPSRSAAIEASPESEKLPGAERPTHIEFRDRAGDVLFLGQRTDAAVVDDADAYVLFGNARPQESEALVTVIDDRLPTWLQAFVLEQLPPVLARYRQQLGPAPIGKPMVMVSWGGAEKDGVSFGGSVLPGTVVMTIGGKQTLNPERAVGNYARWLVSHEAAHFWLGQAVRYETPADSWITEGGAELLAFRAMAAADPTYEVKKRLSRARAECVPFLRNGGVASAYARPDDFRAYYACGAIIALAAEQAAGGDFGRFVRALIDGNRSDGVVTRADWFAELGRQGGGKLRGDIAVLLDRRHAKPEAALDAFIARAGIAGAFAAEPTAQ
ncbi:hypothetical protein G7078_02405 [Sphingomonas sinipercae]|uniref:Peptidase M1 membrane alanine aminopeptidase domain-containing protein n=1 Tax=Sphingomonas sinipercae TaxID=2714944 RepID=A0A6G7ZLF2_9SPHN|nr:hypothetical protein [Sphingomonas sinipercae]QIL01749.1 hypothetical protein G7078_02405 [Sphingomonas sinipercae]